jgi:hypothetical protein
MVRGDSVRLQKSGRIRQTHSAGLPKMFKQKAQDNCVYLSSVIAVEHDVRSYAMGDKNVVRKLNLLETLNPCTREFRAPIIKTSK